MKNKTVVVYRKIYTSKKYKHDCGAYLLDFVFETKHYSRCKDAAKYADACSSYLWDHVAFFKK